MIKGFHIDPWDGLIETVSVNLTVGWGRGCQILGLLQCQPKEPDLNLIGNGEPRRTS